MSVARLARLALPDDGGLVPAARSATWRSRQFSERFSVPPYEPLARRAPSIPARGPTCATRSRVSACSAQKPSGSSTLRLVQSRGTRRGCLTERLGRERLGRREDPRSPSVANRCRSCRSSCSRGAAPEPSSSHRRPGAAPPRPEVPQRDPERARGPRPPPLSSQGIAALRGPRRRRPAPRGRLEPPVLALALLALERARARRAPQTIPQRAEARQNRRATSPASRTARARAAVSTSTCRWPSAHAEAHRADAGGPAAPSSPPAARGGRPPASISSGGRDQPVDRGRHRPAGARAAAHRRGRCRDERAPEVGRRDPSAASA